MQTKIIYSKTQLEYAVRFISKNNYNFLKQKNYIKEQILEYMKELACNPNLFFISCMGFELIADKQLEDVDNIDNICYIEILVDPALEIISSGYYDSNNDYEELSINTKE